MPRRSKEEIADAKLNEAYADLFTTSENGKAVLDDLSIFQTRLSAVENPYQTYRREGNREVVLYILQRIAAAKEKQHGRDTISDADEFDPVGSELESESDL